MARKLTDQQRDTIERLSTALVQILPSAARSYAGGIASALVRLSSEKVTGADLDKILGKYDGVDPAIFKKSLAGSVLVELPDEKDVYSLIIPEAEEEEPATSSEPSEDAVASNESDANASDEASSAQQDDRGAAEESDDGPTGEAQAGVQEETKADAAEAPKAKPRTRRRRHRTTTGSVRGTRATGKQEESHGDAEDSDSSSTSSHEQAGEEESNSSQEAKTTSSDQAIQAAKSAKDGKKPGGAKVGRPSKTANKAKDDTAEEVKAKSSSRRRTTAASKTASPAGAPTAPVKAPHENSPKSRQAADAHERPATHGRDPKRDLRKIPYVRRGNDDDAEIRQKIVALNPRFWTNGWLLSHPDAYRLYEKELVSINDALSDDQLPDDLTRRQLAYQMGGDEKFFEYGSDGFRLLRAMGMEDVIRHRPVPKPDLVYHAPRRRKHMNVLVTENLDPYLDIHDLMYEDGRSSILGQRVHAVVLGGGTPIIEHNRLALLLDTLGAETIHVLYWGDIDRAGLEIMVRLKEVLGDRYKFSAFTPAYQLMLDKAMKRFPNPEDNESTGQINIDPMDASLLTDGLTPEAAEYARAVIDGCCLIPQEILTKHDL